MNYLFQSSVTDSNKSIDNYGSESQNEYEHDKIKSELEKIQNEFNHMLTSSNLEIQKAQMLFSKYYI
jgi:hypothetical protein